MAIPAAKDDKFRVYLEAFTAAMMGAHPIPDRTGVSTIVAAAAIALAVGDAKDGGKPATYPEFTEAMKRLDVIE